MVPILRNHDPKATIGRLEAGADGRIRIYLSPQAKITVEMLTAGMPCGIRVMKSFHEDDNTYVEVAELLELSL